MALSLTAAASGFTLGLGLIIPIGAQNAYVLRTAVRAPRAAVITVVAMVIVIDVTLIGLGAAGADALLEGRDWLRVLLYLGGIALLAPLSYRALRDGLRGADDYAAALEGDAQMTPRAVIGPVLALSLLNPHVYLDTVAILGSAIGGRAPEDRASFAGGAMVASAFWFTALAALGAKVLSRKGATAARVVDLAAGVVMLVVTIVFAVEAISLITG